RDFLDLRDVVAGRPRAHLPDDGGDRVRLHPARGALPALLAHEEVSDLGGPLDEAIALLDESHAAAPQVRASLPDVLEGQGQVEVVSRQEGRRERRLEGPDRASAPGTAPAIVDELPQRRPEGDLEHARPEDALVEREE